MSILVWLTTARSFERLPKSSSTITTTGERIEVWTEKRPLPGMNMQHNPLPF
ncbi:MAG TPA: hypothetical protein VFP20_10835 [Bacteroidales bacterium]|nr:hypothetical protein [Bacteroidales bacterium]